MTTKTDRELHDALLEELRYQHATHTEWMAHMRSQVINSVLEVMTDKLDATGVLTRSYNTAVGSIIVINPGGAAVTVQSGGQSGSTAPTTGRSVTVVPPSSWLAIPIAAHEFVLYGTPAAVVSLQVFTGMQAYGISR